MAYDQDLAQRLRDLLEHRPGFGERKMFGGLCFLLHGNMCCGVSGEEIVLRLGPEGAAAALEEPETRPMDFTGRVMKSMVYLQTGELKTEGALDAWVAKAVGFAESLPPKA